MTNKQLEKQIYKKLVEIKEMYFKAYPNADYLSMAMFKDSIMFNNDRQGKDKNFPLSFWKKDEGKKVCE